MPKITKRIVDSTKHDSNRDVFVWDTEMPRFGLRVKPSAVKSYFIQYRNAEGRSRRMTYPGQGVATPHEARVWARELLLRVDQGYDPKAERDTARNGATVEDLGARYLREHAEPYKKPRSVEEDRRNLKLHVYPTLGHKNVAQITRQDIVGLHRSMEKTRTAANRVVSLLSKMLNLAEEWGLRPQRTNPCDRIKRYRETKRERPLTQTELRRLGKVLAEIDLQGSESPSVTAVIRTLLLTGARRDEIRTLRRDFVDLENRVLRIPDSKEGGPKLIHLNERAVDIVRKQLRSDSRWVFPAKDSTKPLSDIEKPWQRIRKQLGLGDVRVNDFRHTHASISASSGHSLFLTGKLLGHKNARTTERYAHMHDAPLRRASESIGETIAGSMDFQSVEIAKGA